MDPKTKIAVKLVGENGNVFNIIGKVSTALEQAGRSELAKEFKEKCFAAKSYDEVLQLVCQYVEVE